MSKTQRVYTAKDIEQIMILSQDVISLNAPVSNKDDPSEQNMEFGDFLEDESYRIDDELLAESRRNILAQYLNKYLTERERDVIVDRFGLDDGHPKTLEEIACKSGITLERIRQIEAKALRKLRIRFITNNIKLEDF